MPDETLMRTMLFDFYGDLLTDKQREYFDLHYNDDLSLYEIAEMSGTSRQAVWDIIRRAEATLDDTEKKTGLVAKAIRRRRTVADIGADARRLAELTDGEARETALRLLKKLELLAD